MENLLGDGIMKKLTAILTAISILLIATAAHAEPNSLKSKTGSDIGLSLSAYQYKEPGVMSLKGVKMGLDMRTTKVLQDDGFIRADFRYAFGSLDYDSNGTGSATGNQNWYIETRVLVGKDHWINDAVLAPYLGLGYRYLNHDGRGFTTTGHSGYRRESTYFYLPIGVIHRKSLSEEARLVSTLEYDHLIRGKQISHYSDLASGLNDPSKNQTSGYGLKLSFSYEKDNWAFGPYAHYWNIDESDIAPILFNGLPTGFYLIEPKNNTVEIGVKVSQQF